MTTPPTLDRVALPLAETQTLTESRGEGSDPDRDLILAETHTLTKTNNESSDQDDQTTRADTVEWNHGDRHPLLYRDTIAATGEVTDCHYDRSLSMSVDEVGNPLIYLPQSETGTHTARKAETDDEDR